MNPTTVKHLDKVLDMKMDAVPDLRTAIAYCEPHQGYVIHEIFDAILEPGEEHIDWLETRLELIDQMGSGNTSWDKPDNRCQ